MTPAEKKKAYMREYRAKHKDKLRADRAANYFRHHEENLAKRRRLYAKDAERIREQDRQCRAKDRAKVCARSVASAKRRHEKVAAYQRAWRASHEEQLRDYKRRQYEANRDTVKARSLAYARDKPGYRAAIARKRQAVKRACPVGDVRTVVAFYRKVRTTPVLYCHWCKRLIPIGPERTVDHVVPIAAGGHHAIENLVPACRSCNCSKSKRDPKEFAAVIARNQSTAGNDVS